MNNSAISLTIQLSQINSKTLILQEWQKSNNNAYMSEIVIFLC